METTRLESDEDLGITEQDRALYSGPCASAGTKGCAIEGPHSVLDHIRIGEMERGGYAVTYPVRLV